MPARNPAQPKATDESIRAVKRTVLGRLYGRAPLPNLVGLDAPLNSIYALLSQTALNNEGNSALILGPRGSGKTSLVQRALSMLSHTNTNTNKAYHIVHLNGFVHTTDRIALRDIARQLLITQDLEHVLIGSFADAFTYILNLLRSDDESTAIPPVIFVLEEFDLLAQHPKQSLLYTLFDIAQSQQTPIAVLGVTARIDVLDLLEKRVKSRFSHRQIYVHNMASVEEFVQIAREALCIDSSTVSEAFAQQFNKRIEDILTSSTVSQHIEDIFEFGKDVRMLLRAFTLAVSQISIDNPLLNASTVESQFALTNTSAKMKILSSISLLELCLIIAMRSLTQLDISKYNFEMVYDEYKTFMSRHMMAVSAGGAMKIYKKPVALKAFETLVELEIARPALVSVGEGSSVYGRNDLLAGTAAGIRAPKEYRMVQLMLEPMQVVELVSGRVDIPAVIRRWAQQ